MRKSLILVWHSGIFVFLQFGVKLGLKHSLWGNIAISQQSDYLCMSYERRVQSLGEYCNFSTVRLFMHVLWKTGVYSDVSDSECKRVLTWYPKWNTLEMIFVWPCQAIFFYITFHCRGNETFVSRELEWIGPLTL